MAPEKYSYHLTIWFDQANVMTFAQTGFLDAVDGHEVYWHTYGNKAGIPVLFFHGGPGGSFTEKHLDLFDLTRVNLVTFDQRGVGGSRPFGELKNNKTWDIIDDAQRLLNQLGIAKAIVTGHSWGATLAVLFAKQNAQVCSSLVLAAYFGARSEDQDWSYAGVRKFFPNEVDAIDRLRPKGSSASLSVWALDVLLNGSDASKSELIFKLNALVSMTTSMKASKSAQAPLTTQALVRKTIFFHYAAANFFMDESSYPEAGVQQLNLPIEAVHGRFDLDCPLDQIHRLKAHIGQMHIKEICGSHNIFERPMFNAYKQALRSAVNKFS